MGCVDRNNKEYYSYSSEVQEEKPKKEIVSEIPPFIKNTTYRKTLISNDIFYWDYAYTPPKRGSINQISVQVKDKNIIISGKDLLPIKHKIISSKFMNILEKMILIVIKK